MFFFAIGLSENTQMLEAYRNVADRALIQLVTHPLERNR